MMIEISWYIGYTDLYFKIYRWLEHTLTRCVLRHRQSIYFMRVEMGFLPLKCQCTINRLKVDMPVWTACLWIPRSPKQKQMWLIKWSRVTLRLVNNWYSGISLGERRHKVVSLSTSIMFAFSGSFSRGSDSTRTCCSVSFWVESLSGVNWGWSVSSSFVVRSDWPLSGFGVTKTGLTLVTIAAKRGLAVRPLWTVSQPSASFLPGGHERCCVSKVKEALHVRRNHILLKWRQDSYPVFLPWRCWIGCC